MLPSSYLIPILVLLDKVSVFLEYSSTLSEEEVHPEPPYEIIRRQPVEGSRVTRYVSLISLLQ